jgi:hypothetical protein
MANYKIKDLQQAQTLNGAVALEIQDGDSMSTFATLDQIAEFLGNTTPVVLLTKAGPIDDGYLPDMSASEIAAAYDRIVADPIHTVPIVRIPDNGGQYLVPSGYGVHADTKAVIGYYASQTYVLPSSLTLTSETFTLSRLPYTASSMEWADLLNNTALPSGYLGIDSDSTSEEISAAVGGVDAFRKLCSKLFRRNCIVVVSTDPAAANRNASIPVIVNVNRSVGLPPKKTLEIEYISSGKYIALTITESGGTFSAMRTSVSVSDIPNALAGKADLDPATGFVKSSQIGEIVIDSGIFFTDIAEGTANKRIDVPRGYVALAVAVYNYNASALKNVTVQNWTDNRAFIYGATVYNARAVYSVSAAGDKSVYNGTGITIDPTVQFLKVMAKGNTTSGGMRVRVICKYLGV